MKLPPPDYRPSFERCPDCRRSAFTLLVAVAASMLLGVAIGRASLNLHLTGWEQW